MLAGKPTDPKEKIPQGQSRDEAGKVVGVNGLKAIAKFRGAVIGE
jgi:hypothetical protein